MWRKKNSSLLIVVIVLSLSACLNAEHNKERKLYDDCKVEKIVVHNYAKLLGDGHKEPYVEYYLKLSKNKSLKCYLLNGQDRISLRRMTKNSETIFRLENKLLFKSLREIDNFQNFSNLLIKSGKDSCIIHLSKQSTNKTFYLDDEKVKYNEINKMSACIDLKKYVDDFVDKESDVNQ